MMDDIKLLVDAIAQMEGGALYILFAFLGYRLVIFASTTAAIVLVSKLFITKLHDWLITKKKVVHTTDVHLDKYIITTTVNYHLIEKAFNYAGAFIASRDDRAYNYLHEDGCRFIYEAVLEKIQREEDAP